MLTMGASMMLTGGFHEDGLADTSDALGGGYERSQVLIILKDSRIGTFGGCALVVSIVGRALLLARVAPDAIWILPVVGSLARTGPLWLMVTMPYATSSETAKSRDVTRAGLLQASVATGWALLVAVPLAVVGHSISRTVAAFVMCAVVTVVTGLRYRARVGGITGDFLGATEQLCELAIFACFAWN